MPEGLLLGRFLLPIVAAARRRRMDTVQLHRLGIEPDRLSGLDAMVPSGLVYRLLEELATLSDIQELAIEVATSTAASDMGLLGLAVRAAPTARLALSVVVRYQQVVNTVARFHLIEHDGETTLAEDRLGPAGLGRHIAAEVTTMTSIHWARKLLGAHLSPTRVELTRRGTFQRYRSWARCVVTGGAERATVSFASAQLDRLNATGDQEVWQFVSELLAELAGPTASDGPLVHQLKRQLASSLSEGEPTLREMARRLGLSARTLQRRLNSEGEPYSRVLDRLRHELAVAHLGRPTLALSEIAFALGFDEVASFHRAFRRWEHTTPAAFRAARQLKD